MQIYFAIIAAWVGEKELALQYLALAGSTPGASNVANYGELKLNPFWNPIRADPAFQAAPDDEGARRAVAHGEELFIFCGTQTAQCHPHGWALSGRCR